MKTIVIVMKKELYRVFSDRKMVFGLFFMPAIVIIGIYLLMGILMSSMMEDWEEHEPTILIYHAPHSFYDYMGTMEQSTGEYRQNDSVFHITWTDDGQMVEEEKAHIYSGELDLILVFPDDFEEQVKEYPTAESIPDIYTYYNPSEDYSDNARTDVLNKLLEPYRQKLLQERVGDLEQLKIFTVDATNEDSVIQNDNKAQGKIFGFVIPYMITIALFAGAMNLGADSFAGEKERGTMAALLVTPIKRSAIVYGKLFALMILSGLSSLIYGGAMIFAMPLLYRTLGTLTGQDLHFMPSQMVMMLVLIVTLVFLYVALIAMCATFAKNMKEASTYIMPLYMLVLAIGMVSMFRGENVSNLQYFIPLYGSTMALKNVFTVELSPLECLFATISNLVSGALCAYLTAKMFHNEKVMFNA